MVVPLWLLGALKRDRGSNEEPKNQAQKGRIVEEREKVGVVNDVLAISYEHELVATNKRFWNTWKP